MAKTKRTEMTRWELEGDQLDADLLALKVVLAPSAWDVKNVVDAMANDWHIPKLPDIDQYIGLCEGYYHLHNLIREGDFTPAYKYRHGRELMVDGMLAVGRYYGVEFFIDTKGFPPGYDSDKLYFMGLGAASIYNDYRLKILQEAIAIERTLEESKKISSAMIQEVKRGKLEKQPKSEGVGLLPLV